MKTSTTKTAKTAATAKTKSAIAAVNAIVDKKAANPAPATKKATAKSAKPAEALAAAIMSEFLPNFTAPEPTTEISEVALPAVSVEAAPEEPATPATEPVAPIAKMLSEGEVAEIAKAALANALPAPIVPIPSSVVVAKGKKTQGIYQLTSRQNSVEGFKLVGSSSQIEICTRDYMSWCKKNKAPKSMQAEYNRVSQLADLKPGEIVDPTILFKVEVLRVCNTALELDSAKIEFGLTKVKPATPTPEQITEKLAMHQAIADCAKLFAAPTAAERPNYKQPAAAAATLQVAKKSANVHEHTSGQPQPYKINLTRPTGYKKQPAIAAAAPIWQVETPFGTEFTETQRNSGNK